MPLMEIHSIFLRRKNRIERLLKYQEAALEKSRKQELQGAVNEIDLFLKTLEYYSIHPSADNQGIKLMANPEAGNPSLIETVSQLLKKKKD